MMMAGACAATDHPRSRGVYRRRRAKPRQGRGSSPLARGLRSWKWSCSIRTGDHPRSRGVYGAGSGPVRSGRGIIPARAGFTRSPAPTRSARPDHPRSRGVYSRLREQIPLVAGSSPLARGLPFVMPSCLAAVRIIPARAGFTLAAENVVSVRGDHPRSRGVYANTTRDGVPIGGSSPLARGLLLPVQVTRGRRRIIPARAGFTPPASARPLPDADHPRSRGVYASGARTTARSAGSSPLARGLPRRANHRGPRRRIIPARAGFTGAKTKLAGLGQDHPRSRGVYHSATGLMSLSDGSSPLARGLRSRGRWAPRPARIIPARAGFTAAGGGGADGQADHPRSRGVYASR